MYCLNCGKELRPGVAFCASCGAPTQAQGASQTAAAVAQGAPQATAPSGAFAPQGVAQPYVQPPQPYGQPPYGGFAGAGGMPSGLSFSQPIAITAAIAGIFLFVFSPWLELPIIPFARTLGYWSLFTGVPSSLRMGSIVSLNDLYSVWLGQAFQGSSVPVSVNSTISGGSMTFVCVVWQLSIIFTSYCVVSAIRHKGEVLPLRIALGVMAAIALFWIISVSMANGSIISELRMHYSSSSSSYAQLPYPENAIAPAWGAIVSLIVCGLGLVGSVFFGLGERQRH